jgi:predicted RND superfamily exporter protein
MNKTETNRYLMFKAVHAKALEHSEVIQMIPVLATSVQTLGNHIADIDTLNTIYKTAAAGTTAKKSQNRELLVEETDTMCAALYTFGCKSGNQNLMARMDKAESEIGKLRGNEVSDLGKQVVKDLQENAASLGEYGITPEEITEYSNLVNSYDTSADEKDNHGSTAKVARENLSKKFSEVATFLDKEMDKLFKRIRKANREVYNEYCEARVVKELGIRHEAVVVETEQLQPAS